MPTTYKDRITTLSCVEDRGAIRKLTRMALTEFTPQELDNLDLRNQDILARTLLELDGIGLRSMSTFSQVDSYASFWNLVLVSRKPAIRSDDHHFVETTLDYEHIHDGHNQILISPPSGRLYIKGRASIADKSTNFYYPFGNRSKGRREIPVAHTFPEKDIGIVNLPNLGPDFPRTFIGGGEINIPFPQMNFTLQGLVYIRGESKTQGGTSIYQMANDLVGHVSDEADGVLLDSPHLSYLCSEMTWELNDISKVILGYGKGYATYKVGLEFQFNYDTWDTTVVYNDQRTGRPPANVLEAQILDGDGVRRLVLHPTTGAGPIPAGYWQVPALPRRDFTQYFNATFERLGF